MTEKHPPEDIVTAHAENIVITEPQADFTEQLTIIVELAKRYPKAFFIEPKQRKPLVIGIFKQIIDEVLSLIPSVSKKSVRKAMAFYCSDFDYLKALQRETHRIDLNGEPIQEISPKHKNSVEKRINLKGKPKDTVKTIKTPKNEPNLSDSNMAERETLTLKRNPAAAQPAPVKTPAVAAGDTVKASAKSAKITLVLDASSISRIDSTGKKQVKLVVQVGEMKFTADLNSKSYRKALATFDELGVDNCMAILQGSMPKFGVLEGVGLVVQAKKVKEEQPPSVET